VIRRTFLGLDLCGDSLRGVALRRQGAKGALLTDARVTPLPAKAWTLSVREPNIVDRTAFVAAVKATLDPLARGEDRVALSLPDPLGRILLTEVDTAFKSRREGIEMLKWQLKKSLPAEPKDIQLDYQVLEKTETGRYRLVVALMVRSVLQQYEEVLAEAGYHAVVVDFHALHLYNYYRSRLDLGEDFILVGIDDGLLGMLFFQGKVPCFQRHKRIAADPQEVFQEVNLSFAAIREAFVGFFRAGVFLHTDWEQSETLVEALKAAFEREVLVLDPKIERLAVQPLPPALSAGRTLVAAIGAAERLF